MSVRTLVVAAFIAAATALSACVTRPESAPVPPAPLGIAGESVSTWARPGAAIRDPLGRDSQRITLWYAATGEGTPTPRIIGPEATPFFISGEAVDDATPAVSEPAPLIVISHGFAGSARQMAWLGTALAARGYVVAAVDHPGNNGFDDRTPTGALLWWERSDDLRLALDAILADPVWRDRIDPSRIGAIGYSMGGATVVLSLGGRPDPARIAALCAARPSNTQCAETITDGDYGTVNRVEVLTSSSKVIASVAGQAGDRRDPRIRAAVVIAPGLIPAFAPDSLSAIITPVLILQGEADMVTPAAENALALSALLPDDQLLMLTGVGHNEFLGLCGEAARVRYPPLCLGDDDRPGTHQAAIEAVAAFFDRVLVRVAP